jgi:hypothetical protein
MSRFLAWAAIVIGMVLYRVAVPTTAIPVGEHIAGAYFSGSALLLHWLIHKFWSRQ